MTPDLMTGGTGVILFQSINWNEIPAIEHIGDTGTSWWQTVEFTGLRLRIVTYSPDYFANHWCSQGHIVYCLQGAFVSELKSGESFTLTEGMSYIVSDDASTHRSVSKHGTKLLIIDGDFLKLK